MRSIIGRKILLSIIVVCGFAIATVGTGRAELADLADVPLANSPSDAVLPNLLYTLDDSGSMMWDYMPDNVHQLANGTAIRNCMSCSSSSCTIAGTQCRTSSDGDTADSGDPPYFSPQFNQIYYNPDISYPAGVNSLGQTLGDASPTAAPRDAYLSPTTTKNLTTTYPETYYCNTSSPSIPNDLNDTSKCRRNGIDNVSSGYFLYWKNNLTDGGFPNVVSNSSSTSFRNRIVRNTGAPHYFKITPHEYCKDTNLVECALANADGSAPSGFTIPAPIRYCKTTTNAASTSVVSDAAGTTSPKCHKKFDDTNYPYPRYGRFTRVNIVSTTTQYSKSAAAVRPDCANAAYCTYTEELQNFANWYTYYRTRMAMMKTATGRAFLPIDDRYRVGFITINPGSPVVSSRYLPLATFDATQKSAFFSILYSQTNHGSTPLREALSRAGRHYAGITSGINNGMSTDPITHSCQQNFTLLTTDGYWNDSNSDTVKPDGTGIGNQDNVEDTSAPFYVSRASGTLDGLNTQVTTETPITTVEQAVCTGNNSVLGTTCGCTGNLKRVKQRTRSQVQTVNSTDGVQTSSSTNSGTTTYQNITACDAEVRTTVTRVTEKEQVVCTRDNTADFSATPDTNCGCPTGNPAQRRIKQRSRDRDMTVITVDGVPGTPTFSNTGSSTFQDIVACTTSSLTAGPTTYTTLSTISNSTTGSTIDDADITISPNPTATTGTSTSTSTAGGTANTLADVAMYYYKTDLRTSGTKSTNNVPNTDKDFASHQHMTTFTLGLGLQGLMDYTADYESNASSDFAKIKNADSNCAWSTGICNWPAPTSGDPTTLDDLWHAAVNGRGTYYSASDPNSLADGLAGALSALKVQLAAASASATSSPNITETDNYIYSSTFRTVKWDGEITAQRIDASNGNVLPAIVWSAQALLDARATATTDTRTLWTFSSTATTKLKSFQWTNLSSSTTGGISAEQSYFENKCTALSQCPLLNTTQQGIANDGQAMVAYLRGWSQHEGTVFRDRDHVLGDPVNATPAFVKAPRYNFNDVVTPTYASFKSTNASRQGVLYIAANDGMLHAFNGDTGQEIWGYIPRIVFPKLHKLATDNWDVRHEYTVDGSPQVMDVYDSTAGAWKTILVAGLNKGGRGYYALDVTNPASPKGMWEICSDSTLCEIHDDDIGYSYGYPVITKRKTDGKWVVLVTSGINNVSPGTGRGYLYVLDAFTGAVLQKVDNGTGDATTPSGLAKISAFANNGNVDNTATYLYGGDLLGNLWRFDMSTNPPTVFKVAELKDAAGKPQSITTRPELAVVNSHRVVYVGTGRYLGEDDLSDPASLTPQLQWAYQQSLYAIKDRDVNHGNIRTSSPGLQQQVLTDNGGTSRTVTKNAVDWANKDGWYVDFNPGGSSPGERVNLDPLLVLGTLVVATNVPNNNACTVGGDSWLYQFDYKSGSYIASTPGAQAGQKFTGKTLVGVVVVRLPSGVLKGIATGATGDKNPVGVNVGGAGGSGRPVSWRERVQ